MQADESNYSGNDCDNILIELEKYKAIFNESLDAIIVTDGESGKIIDANTACKNILGYNRNELIGRHYLLLFDNTSATPITSIDDVQMFGPAVTAKKIKAKDGSIIPMDITLSTMEFDHRNFVLTTFRDARERLNFEEQIKKYNAELTELNTNKDKFFSIIAHDLKSPLTAVLGYSELLAQEIDELSQQEVAKYSASINRVSKELTELLDNLLTWARMQTGRMDFSPVKIHITTIVEDVFRLLRPTAKLKKIELINNVDANLEIFVDENMLNTVIRNLISNSIKFTEKGEIKVSSVADLTSCEIIIEDSGIGMDAKTKASLFQIDKTKSRPGTQQEKGTGLGLILCKEFVQKHNGIIDVWSKPGSGSKFTIKIPNK